MNVQQYHAEEARYLRRIAEMIGMNSWVRHDGVWVGKHNGGKLVLFNPEYDEKQYFELLDWYKRHEWVVPPADIIMERNPPLTLIIETLKLLEIYDDLS